MQYPVATATLVAAPTNTILRSSDARVSHGNQNRYSVGHQQPNTAIEESRNIQANSFGQQPAASSPSKNSAESQQQQEYRFDKRSRWALLKLQRPSKTNADVVTRGIAARGRQLDGREENSGYEFVSVNMSSVSFSIFSIFIPYPISRVTFIRGLFR